MASVLGGGDIQSVLGDPEFREKIALWANSMTLRPDPTFAAMIDKRQERRHESAQWNQTADYIAKMGRPDLADLVRAGSLDAAQALSLMQGGGEAKRYSVGDYLVDADGNVVFADPSAGKPEGLPLDKVVTAESQYRDDLRQDPVLKDFEVVRAGWNNIRVMHENPSAVSDYALAVGFAKILDPGSVAREGEVAAIANSSALPYALREQLKHVMTNNGRLGPTTRQQIAALASKIYADRAEQARGVLEKARGSATKRGLDPENIYWGGQIEPGQPLPMPTGEDDGYTVTPLE